MHDSDIALSKFALTILTLVTPGAYNWRTLLIGCKGTELASRTTGKSLKFMTHS